MSHRIILRPPKPNSAYRFHSCWQLLQRRGAGSNRNRTCAKNKFQQNIIHGFERPYLSNYKLERAQFLVMGTTKVHIFYARSYKFA